jgi:cytochrome c-type biogenesis protein CcsB
VWLACSLAVPDRTSWLTRLDDRSYRCLGLAFPFLTLGILSGAVWAEQTWGSYWSWDPKETASLVLWRIYAVYLHLRLRQGERGKAPARVAALGGVAVWVCYLGVNLLGKGLHSYGFFQSRRRGKHGGGFPRLLARLLAFLLCYVYRLCCVRSVAP